jgi:hypothetical protein
MPDDVKRPWTTAGGGVSVGEARRQLNALAPEMAEAILVWESRRLHMHSACHCADCFEMERLAEKLRAIGATDA